MSVDLLSADPQRQHAPRVRIIDGVIDEPLLRALRAVCDDPGLWPAGATLHRDLPQGERQGVAAALHVGAHPALEVLAGRLMARFDLDTCRGPVHWHLHRQGPGETLSLRHDGEDPHQGGLDDLRLYASAIVCLEPPDQGHLIAFPEARPAALEIAARPGRLVIWENYRGDALDPAARYHLPPVLQGRRSVLIWRAYAPPPPAPAHLICLYDEADTTQGGLARALALRCADAGVGFEGRALDRSPLPGGDPLSAGAMLLNLDPRPGALALEATLAAPKVGSIHARADGPLWRAPDPQRLLRWAGLPVIPTAALRGDHRGPWAEHVAALGGLPLALHAPDLGGRPLLIHTWPGLEAAVAHLEALGGHPHLQPLTDEAPSASLWVVDEQIWPAPASPEWARTPAAEALAVAAIAALGRRFGGITLRQLNDEVVIEGPCAASAPPAPLHAAVAEALLGALLRSRGDRTRPPPSAL